MQRPSYSAVMSTLAVVLALGGGSAAIAISSKAPKNSVTAKSLRKNAVTSRAIRDGAVGSAELAAIRIDSVATIAWTSNNPVTLDCKPNERLIGGGANLREGDNSFSETKVLASYPSGNGWAAVATGSGPRPTLSVYAICLTG